MELNETSRQKCQPWLKTNVRLYSEYGLERQREMSKERENLKPYTRQIYTMLEHKYSMEPLPPPPPQNNNNNNNNNNKQILKEKVR